MKEVIYLPGIRRNPEIVALAEQATVQLEEIVKAFASIVSAEWDLINDRGRPEVTLRLWDDTGSVTTRFPSELLKDSDKTYDRLHRLWSDLLSVRSHAIIKRLEAMMAAYEGD